MKTLKNSFLLVLMLLMCSSCFEITEEVIMKEDGSGTFKLTANLSESRQSLVNYMKVGEVDGMEVPSREEVERELDLVYKTLSEMEGLSEVKIRRDFDQFIFSLSGAFANVEVLNDAINEVAEVLNRTSRPLPKEENFDFSSRAFKRYFKYPIQADIYDEASLSAKYMMDTARLISIFRFPKKVGKVSNKNTLISPSRKSVMLQASIAELAKGEVVLENEISF